ncbi:MAG: hypothetical protein JWM10_2377 [Myxococcaceae bacterium]|nr:hypothetical protein [Myxococcaceae bacterium]
MLVLLAQLHCAIELVPATEPSARALAPVPAAEQSAAGTEHVFDYVDALSGERLSPGDVGALVPIAYGPSGALATRVREDDEAGAPIRRFIALPPDGEYTVRVDGLGSRRYFGCEARLPAAGDGPRRVRITLLPRARDVSLTAEIERGDARRELTPMGLREVELRPDARSERELEVVRGTCSGERPPRGSHWCVLSLAAEPGAVGLTARAPAFGLASMSVAMTDPARSVAVSARYPGHLLGAFSLRLGAAIGLLHGDGPGATVAVDVPTRSEATGGTCPAGDTCLRGLVHLGATYGSYRRDTELVGPTTQVTPDGETSATYGLLEAGAGVTVAPGGTGDRLRLTGILAGVLAARTEERRANNALLSEGSSRLGLVGDVLASVRFAGPWTVFAGLRALWLPSVGARGRQFSYLGAAPVSAETASLVQLGLLIGLGVDP